MLEADRAKVGWESPEDWEFDSETLASKIAKLKKKQDGEVEKSTPTHAAVDLEKEVALAARVSKAKRSKEIVSPSPALAPALAGRARLENPCSRKLRSAWQPK
jgi:hypothetical protein